MNELTKEIARALVKCKNVGMPGGDSIDLGNTEVLASYSIVAESRGILAEDVVRATAAILDRQYFPRPYDAAEACMPFKAKRDQDARNAEVELMIERENKRR